MEKLYQLGLSSRRRLPLFPDAASQRRAVTRLARALPGKLVLFSLLFEHGHLGVLEEERRIGLLRRTVRCVLQPLAAQPIEPVWCERIDGRRHLRALLRYWLTQPQHHDVPGSPALWDGSCFLDLVGARRIPQLDLRYREVLPDVRLAELFALVGLPKGARALDDARIRELGLARIAVAAAAALGLHSLEGPSPGAIDGRRVVAQLASSLELPPSETRRVLSVSRATTFRLISAPRDPELHRVLRSRLAIEEAVLGAPVLVPQCGSDKMPP